MTPAFLFSVAAPAVAAAVLVPVSTLMDPSVPRPVPDNVVKAPAAGTVPPIAGGEAKSAVMPAPDGAPVEVSVVKLPGRGVVAPIVMLSMRPGVLVAGFGAVNGKTMSPSVEL